MLRNSIDLTHADGSDDKFSLYWSGHENYLRKSDYPIWIEMCRRAFYAFEGDYYMKVPAELEHEFGLNKDSDVVDVSNGTYRQFGDVGYGSDSQKMEIKRDKKNIKSERTLWTLSSVRKLIVQYMAYKLYQVNRERRLIDIFELKNKLVNQFAKNLVRGVINEVFDSGFSNVREHQLKTFEKAITDDLLLLLNYQSVEFFLERVAFFGEDLAKIALQIKTQNENKKTLELAASELQVVVDGLDRQATIDDANAAARASVKEVVGAVQAAQRVKTAEISEIAAQVETEEPSVLTSNLTPATTLVTVPPIASMPTDSRPTPKRSLATAALLAIGAITGVVVLGIVIAATHGVALPLIAGIGTAILVGHGSVAAGLAVGCSLFGSAAAAVGACITYAAKKTYDFVNWCCCGKQSESDIRDSHDHIEHVQVGRSPSTTSLLDAAMSDEQHDYKSMQSSGKEEVSPLLSGNASPRDNHPVSSRAGWAGLFCRAGGTTRQQLVVSEPRYQQRLGHPL